jgi:DNA-binding CsgD family transcriptional regulator
MHCFDAARCGQAAAAAERVEQMDGRVTGPLLPVLVRHVVAWGRSDADGLDAASQAYADLGAYLPAAEAAVIAAQVHQDAGRRTAAATSGTRAAALVDRCAGCHTPVLESGLRPSPLTARELEVARLAAQRLSNRQIAARLGISTRTVETHLLHAYDKLGVADRSRLGAALGIASR